MRIASALAPLVLAACGAGGFVDPPRTDRIDAGGSIWARAEEVASANARQTGRQRPLPQTCLSSCTMYLALEEGCLRAGTRLGLHGPAWDANDPMTGADLELWSRIMAAHYPEMVRTIFWEAARLRQDITFIDGDTLIAAGIIPPCAG